MDPFHIRGWQRLDPRTTTSGALQSDDVAQLVALGVRHVINLALADSPGALASEAELLAAAGIRYTHIPVPFDAPDEDQYHAFVNAFRADSDPVHVHCIMNWCVSAFFYRYHCETGMAEYRARQLMQQQWDPGASDDPRAGAWADLIGRART